MSTDLVPAGGQLVREEFGAREISTIQETAAAAVAAREQAIVQARYIMAIQRPRNVENFRVKLNRECNRFEFADKAKYSRPVGRKKDEKTGQWVEQYAEGPTIRFVEAALQHYGNASVEVFTTFDGPGLRICSVTVTDLESNFPITTQVQVAKVVERKGTLTKQGKWEPPKGRTVLSERINSYGDPTYLVAATDDEVTVKQNALISKAIRTNALRILPPDIVAGAMELAATTVAKGIKDDPDAQKRAVIDAFAKIGVTPSDLQEYIGHSLDRLQPAELTRLRGLHAAIKEGEMTWQDALAAANDGGGAEEDLAAKKAAMVQAAKKTAPAPAKPQEAAKPVEAVPVEDEPAEAEEESEAEKNERAYRETLAREKAEVEEAEARQQQGTKPQGGFQFGTRRGK